MTQPDPRFPGGFPPNDPPIPGTPSGAPPPGGGPVFGAPPPGGQYPGGPPPGQSPGTPQSGPPGGYGAPQSGPPAGYGAPQSGPPAGYGPPPGGFGPGGPILGGLPPGQNPDQAPVFPFGQPPTAGPGAQRPEPVVPVPARSHRARIWPKVLAVIAAVVVLAGLVGGSYALVRNNNAGNVPAAHGSSHPPTGAPTQSPEPTTSPLDVSSRETDPRPLTVHEVFPNDDIRPDPGRDATYHVLKTDTVRSKCAQAATGDVGGVLTRYGCNQVVRATLTAPIKGYVLTAGICNLSTAGGAQSATDKITELGRQTRGSLTGFAAPGPAAKLATSPTVYALQTHGHYVLYVVVGRTDGKAPASDATTQQIVTDVVQTYLTGVIDQRRAND